MVVSLRCKGRWFCTLPQRADFLSMLQLITHTACHRDRQQQRRPSAGAGFIGILQTSVCLVLALYAWHCVCFSGQHELYHEIRYLDSALTSSLSLTHTPGLTLTPCISIFAYATICILQKVLPAFALASLHQLSAQL